jgi:hypothetical protein
MSVGNLGTENLTDDQQQNDSYAGKAGDVRIVPDSRTNAVYSIHHFIS